MNLKSVLAWWASAMCQGGYLWFNPWINMFPSELCTGARTVRACSRTRVSAQSYSPVTPAKRKRSKPSKCCVSLDGTQMDKWVMIPLRPLMIGCLVQPKPRWTPTLMFQGFAETESSAKHLWQAGSDWHHLFQLTLSVVGVSAQQIWGFLKPRRSTRNFASLPIILQLLCVYVDLIAMRSVVLPTVYNNQTLSWASARRRGLPWSSTMFGWVCMAAQFH